MRSMGWIVVLGLLVLILAFVPIIDGLMFKRNLVKLIDVINRDDKVHITIVEYRMGWLSSDAKLQINARDNYAPNSDASSPKIIIESNIAHGPFVKDKFNNEYTLAAASIHSRVLADNIPLQGKVLLSDIYSVTTGFGNVWHNIVVRAPVSFSMGGGSLSWDGFKGNVNFAIEDGLIKDLDSKIIVGKLIIDIRQLGKPIESISFDPITYEYQANEHSEGLWIGKTNIIVPEIMINMVNGRQTLIQNLISSTSILMPSADMLNLGINLDIQKLQLPFDLPPIAPFQQSITFNNFSLQGLQAIRKAGAELRDEKPTKISEEQIKKIQELVVHVVTPTSNIQANLLLKTELGDINSHLKIDLPPDIAAPLTKDEIALKARGSFQVQAAIPLVNKLITLYAELSPVQRAQTTTSATSENDMFSQSVATMLQQGKIDLPTSMKLIGLHNKELSPLEFSTNVDELKLPPAVATQVKSEYQTLYTVRQQQKAQMATQANVTSPEAQRQAKIAAANQLINTWLQNGYILIDQNNYVMTITRNNGILLINGKPMPMEGVPAAASPVPATVPTPAPQQNPSQPPLQAPEASTQSPTTSPSVTPMQPGPVVNSPPIPQAPQQNPSQPPLQAPEQNTESMSQPPMTRTPAQNPSTP